MTLCRVGTVDHFRPIPVRHGGMPAMVVVAPAADEGMPVKGVMLAEGGDGLPRGFLVEVRDGIALPAGTAPYYQDETGFGLGLACGWLNGGAFFHDHADLRGAWLGVGGAREVGDAARQALPACGFSDEFVEVLEAVTGWNALNWMRDGLIHGLFGKGDASARLRRFVATYPLMTLLTVRDAIPAAAREGRALDPCELLPGLTPTRARIISGPSWRPDRPVGPGQTATLDADLSQHDFDPLVRLVIDLPVEWLPRDDRQVEAFWSLAVLLVPLWNTGGLDMATLAAPGRGDWEGLLRRCDAFGPEARWVTDPHGGNAELMDPLRHFTETVVLPLMTARGADLTDPNPDGEIRISGQVPRRAVSAAAGVLYGGKGLPSVLAIADEWHTRFARIERAMPRDAGHVNRIDARHAHDRQLLEEDAAGNPVRPTGKPPGPLLPEATVDGITLTFLTGLDDLRAEGSAWPDASGSPGLDHCVASYAGRVAGGRTHVVSLRKVAPDGTYERLATAEVQVEGREARVVQLRGRRNARPPEGCREALDAYLSSGELMLSVGARKAPDDPLGAHLLDMMVGRYADVGRHAAASRDPVRHLCGYDWRDPEMLRRACLAYAPLLPRDLRGGPDAIAARLGLPTPSMATVAGA